VATVLRSLRGGSTSRTASPSLHAPVKPGLGVPVIRPPVIRPPGPSVIKQQPAVNTVGEPR